MRTPLKLTVTARILPSDVKPKNRPAVRWYLAIHSLVLLGYALGQRPFSYVSVGSIYIGEILLALGVLVSCLFGASIRLRRSALFYLLTALALWSAIRTVPFMNEYGIDALRDAALWGYSVFAFIIASLVAVRSWPISSIIRNMPSLLRYS